MHDVFNIASGTNHMKWTQTAQVFTLLVLAHTESDYIWHIVTEFHIL